MLESKKLSAYWWWFDSKNNSITRNSPWLISTLADLDEKTESMLNLIDQEAETFSQRAEMYYRKRPELIKLIEDLYRNHRALALHYDQATKCDSDSISRVKIRQQTSHPITHTDMDMDRTYDSYSDSIDLCHDQNESEIEDHQSLSGSNDKELMNLRAEIERLREENKIQKEMLGEKDEEKREAIRQLSLCVDLIKQENLNLKKRYFAKGKRCILNRE